MGVEITNESRDVVKRDDGKYVMTFHQVQEYDPENVEAMIADFNKKLTDYQAWLDKFDEHVKAGNELLLQQLTAQKIKLEGEVQNLKEGIELWSNVRSQNK